MLFIFSLLNLLFSFAYFGNRIGKTEYKKFREWQYDEPLTLSVLWIWFAIALFFIVLLMIEKHSPYLF